MGRRVRSQKFILAREARGYSQEELASRAGVSVKTIGRIERGDSAPHPQTLSILAQALGVTIEGLLEPHADDESGATGEAKQGDAENPGSAPTTAVAEGSARPVRLDTLVARELRTREPEQVDTPMGRAHVLGARWYQDMQTGYVLFDGRLFLLEGRVDRSRGVADAEANLLGSENGVAARFLVYRMIADDLPPLAVHIFSAKAEHTEALLALRGRDARLVLRLHAQKDHVPKFHFIDAERPKPWALVVEGIGEG